MKNKKPENQQKPLQGFILPVVLVLIFLVLIPIIYKKYSENHNYHIIKVTGVPTVSNISKLELFAYSSRSKDSACYTLAEKGDLLSLDNVLYLVSASTPDSMNVTVKEDTATYINGKLYTIIVNDKVNLVPFLKSLREEEIKSLANLELKTIIPTSYLPFLSKIASVNNDVSLYFPDDSGSIILKDYFSKANYFNPKILSGNISASLYPHIAGLTNINTLFISIEDSITVPLPMLPNLKTCIVIDAGEMSSPMVMQNNVHASFLFADTDVFTNKDLRKFKQLPTLGIHIYDSAVLSGLDENTRHTSTLYISADSNVISSELAIFSNVKWLIIEGNLSTTAFTKTLSYFKNIQVLELINNEKLAGYKSLEGLAGLKALILRDTATDLNTLSSLQQLKYLSLPEDIYSDSTKLNALEKLLPGCIIAPNSGACMGSGWLLLIPALVLFKFYFSRKIPT